MPKIKLDQLEEGMIIAKDVKNMDDMLLIPSGCELTHRHIDLLHTWGISEVQVESSGEAEAADPLSRMSPEAAEILRQETINRFCRYDRDNPVEAEMFQLILRRRARQLQET